MLSPSSTLGHAYIHKKQIRVSILENVHTKALSSSHSIMSSGIGESSLLLLQLSYYEVPDWNAGACGDSAAADIGGGDALVLPESVEGLYMFVTILRE